MTDEQSEPVDIARLQTLAQAVIAAERYPDESEVALTLVTDEVMAEFNERFMDRQGPTDVLALPIEELQPGVAPEHRPGTPPVMLGDVIIAPRYVGTQANQLGSEAEDEIALMVVHGLLHLMGWDHVDGGEAELMEARERSLLAGVGVVRS